MRKRHNEQKAVIYVNGEIKGHIYNSSLWYSWGWTERTECTDLPITKSVASYYNRSWQQFDYQVTMRDMLDKLRKYFARQTDGVTHIKVKIVDERNHVVEW